MRKLISLGMLFALTGAPMLAARPDNDKETDRLENAGMVMEEILNIPDDIPQDLLDKAECVIVFPSVLKAAFGSEEAMAAARWSAAAANISPARGARPR